MDVEVFFSDGGAEGEGGFLLAHGARGRDGVKHVQDTRRPIGRFITLLVTA